jgi:hypothetical protein
LLFGFPKSGWWSRSAFFFFSCFALFRRQPFVVWLRAARLGCMAIGFLA